MIYLDTSEIMKIGLKLAGWKKIPHDSTIHLEGKNISKILLTIDVTVSELLLAKELDCDCVIGHHPIGITHINFSRVFNRHLDYMLEHGISRKKAKILVGSLVERVNIRTHSSIYNQVIDAAKLLNLPLVNIHQPLDEYMRQIIYNKISQSKPKKIQDIINILDDIPEFHNAATKIIVPYGNIDNNVDKWALVIAAGTNGGYQIAKAYFEHGISTVIYLHIDYSDLLKLRESKSTGNLVVLGHLAGDSIGINGLSSELIKRGVEVVKLGIL
ncbi:MAG: hypothetical protein DA328_01585 [Nitrososphaeraceae archaeon]|nr:hypothetical protein [Nitrososphaeraceae archaeon]